MLRRNTFAITLALGLLLGMGSTALADNPPGTGQPGASCETSGARPGGAASAPGSAFNPTGTAGTVYAGEQPQTATNPTSGRQYDDAGFPQAQHWAPPST